MGENVGLSSNENLLVVSERVGGGALGAHAVHPARNSSTSLAGTRVAGGVGERCGSDRDLALILRGTTLYLAASSSLYEARGLDEMRAEARVGIVSTAIFRLFATCSSFLFPFTEPIGEDSDWRFRSANSFCLYSRLDRRCASTSMAAYERKQQRNETYVLGHATELCPVASLVTDVR